MEIAYFLTKNELPIINQTILGLTNYGMYVTARWTGKNWKYDSSFRSKEFIIAWSYIPVSKINIKKEYEELLESIKGQKDKIKNPSSKPGRPKKDKKETIKKMNNKSIMNQKKIYEKVLLELFGEEALCLESYENDRKQITRLFNVYSSENKSEEDFERFIRFILTGGKS